MFLFYRETVKDMFRHAYNSYMVCAIWFIFKNFYTCISKSIKRMGSILQNCLKFMLSWHGIEQRKVVES